MQRHKLQKPLHTSGPSAHTQSNNHVSFTNLSPQTPAEHYWASRALKAEALLSAREKHYEEVGRVREEEELKRRVCLFSVAKKFWLIGLPERHAELREQVQGKVQ